MTQKNLGGRPPIPAGDRRIARSFRLDPEALTALEEMAQTHTNGNVSAMIDRLVIKESADQSETVPQYKSQVYPISRRSKSKAEANERNRVLGGKLAK